MNLIIIDLFCGAGGFSHAAEAARLNGHKVAKVIACANHDANAIKSHLINMPDAVHFLEDIRDPILPEQIKNEVIWAKIKYPKAKVLLHASLECTSFSIAKGGQSRNADSRALAEEMDHYIELIKPDFFTVENVREFLTYGPLIHKYKDGIPLYDKIGNPIMHPDPKHKGKWFDTWRHRIDSYGYHHEYKLLNSKDFGACQNRLRLFMQFVKVGEPIFWPKPTHGKPGSGLLPYEAVKKVLNLKDEGNSIFSKKKCERTLERIYAGLIKYVAKGDTTFLTKYHGGHIRTQKISEPCSTISTGFHPAVVFLVKYHKTGENILPITGPVSSQTTKDRIGVVHTKWLDKMYNGSHNHSNIEEPAGTLTSVNKNSLVTPVWLDKMYTGKENHSSIEDPCGTIMVNPKERLMTPKFIDNYLLNPQYDWPLTEVDKPSPTVIARQDKMPLSLINLEKGEFGIIFNETDTEATKKIKIFMLAYGISDIKMRMLHIDEQKLIQGLPKDYKLLGTQAEQKKFIGNAVEGKIGKALIEAICSKVK